LSHPSLFIHEALQTILANGVTLAISVILDDHSAMYDTQADPSKQT
jgi:hypothetical protein